MAKIYFMSFQTNMKIANQPICLYSQQPPKKLAFKGWAAAPIKEIYVQLASHKDYTPFLFELNKKCKQYFKIVVQSTDNLIYDMRKLKPNKKGCIEGGTGDIWSQDNKIFFENGDLGIFPESNDPEIAENLAKKLKIKSQIMNLQTQGGNYYLGKKTNGENFALVGIDALDGLTKETAADALHVDVKNLHVISQPSFHIDVVVRPLTYPYVLVGDPNLTAKLAREGHNEEQCKSFNKRLFTSKENLYATTDDTVKELENQGFKAIRVPGLIAGYSGLNFMNAIVHQKPNGKLIYITNKTSIGENIGIDFGGIFEKYLKSKCPEIEKIIYIDGKGFVQKALTKILGGTHCMTCEKPDFEKWNAMLKKQGSSAVG